MRPRAAAVAALLLVVLIAVRATRDSHPPLPSAASLPPPAAGDPFRYEAERQAEFVARATAGESHVLFALSPGGVLATAARVARFRPEVDAAAAGTAVSPQVLEGIVFLESAGRPQVIAGSDPAAAAGLTQILAGTGQGLLRMHIDLAASRRLTASIDFARAAGRFGQAARLQAKRAAVDERFNPVKALRATVRYLTYAGSLLGRPDLAIESYHMGIGNLRTVLSAYDGGRAVPYAQLYFDSAPDRHAAAFRLLASFGDDSSTYLWRVYGAMQIMSLYRSDQAALRRLASLQTAAGSAALVLHPPDRTASFADPDALYGAYGSRVLVRLPRNPAQLGLAYNRRIGWLASRLRVPYALYQGLRPAARDLLVVLAARARALSGASPLIVQSAVLDKRYEALIDESFPGATTGYSFQIARRYVSGAQAAALQAMLDRLQALNVIAWERSASTIDVAVASDASRLIGHGV